MINSRHILVFITLTFGLLMQPASAQGAPDKVRFRLDWTLTGYQLPFFWAEKKGYYRDEGLDVEIKPGAGSQQTINLVGGGHDDLGFADYSLMAVSVSKGMSVRAIYGVIQSDAWSIFSHKSRPIKKPSDLSGKSVVCIADHKPMLDLLLKLNNVDPSTVQIRIVSAATRDTVFAQKTVDGLLAISIASKRPFGGADVDQMSMSAYGVNMLGQGIIGNDEFLKKNPDVVRRFLKATERAFQDVIQEKNFDEAIKIALAATGTSEVRADYVREEWTNTLTRLHSKNTQGKPVGWMSDRDWDDTLKTLKDTNRIDAVIPTERLFTNEFILKNSAPLPN